MVKIAVVIPTYNRKSLLRNLLLQLNAQKLNKMELYIVVVVDGSNDGTYEMLDKDFHNISIVKGSGNWWYTKCMNEGFKFAEKFNPDFVLTLNDDLEVGENYIQTLMSDFYSLNDENTILGSITLSIEKKDRVFFSGIKIIKWWRYKSVKYHSFLECVDINTLKGTHPSEALPGRGMLIPFEILKLLNYFDLSFVQYGSDEDFCYRAQKRGYKIYISWNAKIFSHIKETSKSSPQIEKSFSIYLKSFLNKYSPNYILTPIKIIIRNTKLYFVPVTLLFIIAGKIKAFFRYAK